MVVGLDIIRLDRHCRFHEAFLAPVKSFPKLSFACPIPWAGLPGNERAKFCDQCGHTIVNFSTLTEAARRELLERAGPEKLCVTYYRRLSGEYVTPESPLTREERSRIKQLGVATLSAGALALAAGCMSTPAAKESILSPRASEQTPPAELAALTDAEKLARYDRNRNGQLDPAELATAKATAHDRVDRSNAEEPMVLQPFGIVAAPTPSQARAWIDRQIQRERRNEPTEPEAAPSPIESWPDFWARTIRSYRNPRQIGGADPHAEEYARYIVSQRQKYRLPELPAAPSR